MEKKKIGLLVALLALASLVPYPRWQMSMVPALSGR